MALRVTQRNDVFGLINTVGLDALSFDWVKPPGSRSSYCRYEDILVHKPTLSTFEFTFNTSNGMWRPAFKPGADGSPETEFDTVPTWFAVLPLVERWLKLVKEDAEAPDLWEELYREREALTRPAGGSPARKHALPPRRARASRSPDPGAEELHPCAGGVERGAARRAHRAARLPRFGCNTRHSEDRLVESVRRGAHHSRPGERHPSAFCSDNPQLGGARTRRTLRRRAAFSRASGRLRTPS